MARRVIVIASGETERRALPHLVAYLEEEHGVVVQGVRIPPRNKALDAGMAERLARAAWHENPSSPPDKFVVVVDVDRDAPEDVVRPFRSRLAERLAEVEATVLCAYAQQHLEAWYFGDADNLRSYLDRDLGNVDTSAPDEIQNPKLHLKHLLDRTYTSLISADIASRLDPKTIAQRSPSFKGFVDAIMNGVRRSKPVGNAIRRVVVADE